MKSAVLFVNHQKKYTADLAVQIKTELENRKIKVDVISVDGKQTYHSVEKRDIAFSLGGDGTVLYTARCLSPLGVPILPVNLGTLGFIAEVEKEDWLDVFSKWEKGEISVSSRCMFDVVVERNSSILSEKTCLNDAVVSASRIAKLIKLDVYIENEQSQIINDKSPYYKKMPANNRQFLFEKGIALGSFRCDGLIISTPTGSTAYSMAAGGPILDPEMEAVIVNPICPFALSSRPFVLPSRQKLLITVAEKQRSGVLLTIDGQDTFDLECGDKVIVQQAVRPALLILAGKHNYYSALRNKLFWSPSLAGGDS
ncbi:MAG: NAD(+)/NADH kinase [Treponema sp.]|nr:NAD(+)/NADH kinase [Treponema sp.]